MEILMTPLDKPLKRQIEIKGQAFTVTLDATGIKITRKAHRNGIEHRWTDLIPDDHAAAAPNDAPPSHHHT
jgi:hypothetical protein